MPFQLVYLPKSGNKNYWTTNGKFTHKADQHFFWSEPAQLIADFPVLKSNHPTRFTNRRDDRFFIYDDNDKAITRLVDGLASPPQTLQQPIVVSIKPTPKAYYAISANITGQQYYYDSTKGKNGSLIYPADGDIRFWKRQELDKAIATARNLCLNKKFLQKLPGLRPEHLAVVNIRTGLPVWPVNPLEQVRSAEEEASNSADPTTELLAEVKTQLSDHFNPANQEGILNDRGERFDVPTVDLDQYSAPQIFAALCYIIEAVSQREAVDNLLNIYDRLILQDYLHTVELTDIQQLNNAAFVESLQQMRQKRRKIKDLSILIDVIDENINQDKILKQLLSHQSLHTQYHYRNHEIGNQLLKMINPRE